MSKTASGGAALEPAEKEQYAFAISTSRDLASAYAKVLRAVESPISVSKYARRLSERSPVSSFQLALQMTGFLAILVIVCVIAFRPPLSQAIEASLLSLLVIVVVSLLSSRLCRTIVWPVAIRLITIDFFVKTMIHHHIERHLGTLRRQYSALVHASSSETILQQKISRQAERYKDLAESLQSFRGIIYVSSPPIAASLLSSLDLPGILGSTPLWLRFGACIYVFYVALVCFGLKREILLGDAIWLQSNPDKLIYDLENKAYAAVRVEKKREFPLDHVLAGGVGVILVGLSLWLLATGSGPTGGIVGMLGGGRLADSVIPLGGGMFTLWWSISKWKKRRLSRRA